MSAPERVWVTIGKGGEPWDVFDEVPTDKSRVFIDYHGATIVAYTLPPPTCGTCAHYHGGEQCPDTECALGPTDYCSRHSARTT